MNTPPAPPPRESAEQTRSRASVVNNAALFVYLELVDRFTKEMTKTPMRPDQVEELTTLIQLYERQFPDVKDRAAEVIQANRPAPKPKFELPQARLKL